MNLLGRSSCAAHRAALFDFVDRREKGPGTDAALAHLDRCRACETELVEMALTITALRRIWSHARAARPPDQTWRRLRRRLERPPAPAWRTRLPMASLIVGATFVAMVLAPALAWQQPGKSFQEAGTDPIVLDQRTRREIAADRLAETRFVNARLSGPSGERPIPWHGFVPRPDPDHTREASDSTTSTDTNLPVARVE